MIEFQEQATPDGRFIMKLVSLLLVGLPILVLPSKVHSDTIKLESPANLQTVNCAPTFSWTYSALLENEYFEILLGKTPSFGVFVTELTETSWTPSESDFLENGEYLWKVQVVGSGGVVTASQPLSFVVDNVPAKAIPTLPLEGQYTNAWPKMKWQGETDYSSPTFDIIVNGQYIKENIFGTEYQIPDTLPLSHGPKNWRVKTTGCLGETSLSDTYNFMVDANPPESIVLSGPDDGEWYHNGDTINFSWTPTDDLDSGLAKTEFIFDGVSKPYSNDSYVIHVGGGEYVVDYDFETSSQMSDWTLNWPWHREYESYFGNWMLSPNYGDSYLDDQSTSAYLNKWAKIESGTWISAGVSTCTEATYDYCALEGKVEGNSNWKLIRTWSGDGDYSVNNDYSANWIASSAGKKALFRFRFQTDSYGIHSACKYVDSSGIWISSFAVYSPYPKISDGYYPWKVVATDAVGNVRSSEVRHVGIDTVSPYSPAGTAFFISNTANTEFSWSSASDALSGIAWYRLYVDGDYKLGTTSQEATLQGLADGSYSWMIRSFDKAWNYIDSAESIVIVDTVPPTAPIQTSPGANVVIGNLVPNLCFMYSMDGAEGSGIDHYDVWFDGEVLETVSPSSGEICVAAYSLEGPHEWKVIAFDKAGWSSSSSTRTYYVDLSIPESFGKTSPLDGIEIPNLYPTFCWDKATDLGSFIAKYSLSVKDESDTTIIAETVSGSTDNTCVNTGPLDPGTYTWQVSATDGANKTAIADDGQSWTVTLQPDLTPPQCSFVQPAKGSALTEGPVSIQISAADDEQGSGIHLIKLCMDEDCVNDSWVQQSFEGDTEVEWTYSYASPASGEHVFQCIAVDREGNEQSIPDTLTFTFDGTGPTKVEFLAPVKEGEFLWLDTDTTTIHWEPSTDDYSGVSGYQIDVDDDVQPNLLDVTEWTLSDLDEGVHVVKIRGVDNYGNEGPISEISFGVDITPPEVPILLFPIDGSCVSNPLDLQWDPVTDEISGVAKLTLLVDEEVVVVIQNANAINHQTVIDAANGLHDWSLLVTDEAENESTSLTGTFLFDLSPPECLVNEVQLIDVAAGTSVLVTGSAKDIGCGGLTGVQLTSDPDKSLELTPDSSGTWMTSWIWDPDVTGELHIECHAEDSFGLESTSGKMTVVVDQCYETGSCDIDTKACSWFVEGIACDDGNLCTTGDLCLENTCAGTDTSLIDCDDGNPCTSDDCDPTSGCIHTPNTDPCDDENLCTVADTCNDGICAGTDTSDVECDDGNPCTDDSCSPSEGCSHTINQQNLCQGVHCSQSVLYGESACLSDGTCSDPVVIENCDDGNACTYDLCSPETGCTYSDLTGNDCDDGNICTETKCQEGSCVVVGVNTSAEDNCCDSHDDCTIPDEKCNLADYRCVSLVCLSCSEDEDCGTEGNRCLEYPSGKYCGIECSGRGVQCPDTMSCVEVEAGSWQCTPEAGDCECVPEVNMGCHEGNVHWFDSCQAVGSSVDECAERGCVDGTCCPEGTHRNNNACEDNLPDLASTDGVSEDGGADLISSVEKVPDTPSTGGNGSGSTCSISQNQSEQSWVPLLLLIACLLTVSIIRIRLRRQS